jgi:AraC-like DNA-binding protein
MSKAHGQRPAPLSEALSTMHMESSLLGIFNLAAPWAIMHPRLDGVICHIVTEGSCCWTPEDGPSIQLGKGDFLAFPHGDAHTLASSPGLPGMPIAPLLHSLGHRVWKPQSQYLRPVCYRGAGGGARTGVVDLISAFPEPRRNPLLRALPRVIHIRAEKLQVLTWLDFFLEMIVSEQSTEAPGYAALVSRIADLVFIQSVRAYLDSHADDARGWLRGLLHPQISRTLQAIHHAPEKDWTVALLAAEAGMSRTPFAREFCARLGQTPIHYLTEWRMHIASRRLAAGIPVNVVSDQIGYASPISFARTFKRIVGVNPGNFRRHRTAAGGSDEIAGAPGAMRPGSAIGPASRSGGQSPCRNDPRRGFAQNATEQPHRHGASSKSAPRPSQVRP